jgi:mannose-6-phosphate isomerase-like protein (cupin superfamily)
MNEPVIPGVLPGITVATNWPKQLQAEFIANASNGRVGKFLVSETNRVRVWYIVLNPGERLPVHKHVLDHFWTVTSAGRGRSHFDDGSEKERSYELGQTIHRAYKLGEFMMHDLENIGQTDLAFVTVEFLDSPNQPLPIVPID